MSSQHPRPKWWQLYLLFPTLLGLFVFDHRLNVSTAGHEIVQIGIMLIVYGLVYWWLKANSVALSREDRRKYYGRVTVLQMPPLLLSEEKDGNHPMFQLPDSEGKGMLSDTFDMELSEPLPLDQVPEMKKE